MAGYDPEREPAQLLQGIKPSDQATWFSGGTAHILPAERAQASFDVEKMITCVDGGKKNTMKRRFIVDSTEDFTGPVVDARKYDLDRDGMEGSIAEALDHFIKIHRPHVERGYVPEEHEMLFMNLGGMMGGYPGYGLFCSTLLGQCDPEQIMWWLPKAIMCQITGCYAQTELGHGSNVRGLETTATYDKETQTFILETPTLTSMKYWPSSMVSATHAVVYAQLIIEGKEYGVHVFMVQLRDEAFRPMPGVEVGDLGSKVGEQCIDIGYLRMKQVRVPRNCMLAKRQRVSKDGKYKKLNEGAKEGGDKMAYLTMMGARVTLMGSAASCLAKASTVAVRYAAVRKQGFKDTTPGISHRSEEFSILDYKMTQYRLLKQLSFAFASRFTYNWLTERMNALKGGLGGTELLGDASDLPEMHASSAGLKGLCCERASLGIEDCRKACGGAGYLLTSGVAALEADFKWRATAEGDTVVMLLQTARYLIKSAAAARKGEELSGLTSCLAPLKDPNFNAFATKPATPASVEGWWDLEYLLKLLEFRTIVSVAQADKALAKQLAAGQSFDQAWQDLTLTNRKLGECHVIYFMMNKFKAMVDDVQDAACKAALQKVAALFALSEIEDGSQWVGLLTFEEMEAASAATSSLCGALRPDAVALVDSWDIPDRVLNSTIGRYDGNVYEAQYSASVHSPLNKKTIPVWLERIKHFLDLDFLAQRNGEDGAANWVAPAGAKL